MQSLPTQHWKSKKKEKVSRDRRTKLPSYTRMNDHYWWDRQIHLTEEMNAGKAWLWIWFVYKQQSVFMYTKWSKRMRERTAAVETNDCEQMENRNKNLYLNKTEKEEDCNRDEMKIYTYFFMKLLTNILTNWHILIYENEWTKNNSLNEWNEKWTMQKLRERVCECLIDIFSNLSFFSQLTSTFTFAARKISKLHCKQKWKNEVKLENEERMSWH